MKLLKVLVAALVMAAMVTPVFAEDRLSLSGEMRVRSFHVDYDSDDDTKDIDTETWVNQRLRIAGKIAVAEGVSVTFRTDITEGTDWGNSSPGPGIVQGNGAGHGRSGGQQQWDRAHLDLTMGNFHLRAGQQYVGSGGTWAVDTQDSGLALDIESGFPVKLFMIVDNDNGSKSEADAFLYGAFGNFKGDSFKSRLILSGFNDGDEKDVYMAGINAGTLNLGAIKLFGELDFFSGDHEDKTATEKAVDAFGTQLYVDASMAASDTFTVGAQLFYAMGDDEDQQYVRLGNGFNGWDPIYDVGTSLSNEQIAIGNPFDFTGESAGVVGGRLYTSIKMSDSLALGLSAAYLSEEEDKLVESDGYAVAAGLTYGILENTSLQLQLQYEDFDREVINTDADNDIEDFDAFRAGTGIFVKF